MVKRYSSELAKWVAPCAKLPDTTRLLTLNRRIWSPRFDYKATVSIRLANTRLKTVVVVEPKCARRRKRDTAFPIIRRRWSYVVKVHRQSGKHLRHSARHRDPITDLSYVRSSSCMRRERDKRFRIRSDAYTVYKRNAVTFGKELGILWQQRFELLCKPVGKVING